MSTAAVFERRNKQIQDAVDGQNFKQALQLCEKRLKKGEDTSFLRAWKANILFNHADAAHHQRGISEALELCRADPPITDVEALQMLQNTLAGLEEHASTARSIWENAAKTKPKEVDIQLRWFNLVTEAGDWKTAQKAAMSLQSNFPKTRKYYFWAIFMCYLAAEDPNSSNAERNLFGPLAYRMASKAAASVPSDPKELLSPARAIQTTEELLLLIKIYSAQGRYDEVISLLDSEHLGINSRIVQGGWSFVTAKLDALEKASHWDKALAFTRELLVLPDESANEADDMSYREKDDWRVWSLLLTATQKLEKDETVKDTEDFITSYLQKRPTARNAQLARIELVHQKVLTGSSEPSALLSECISYFEHNGRKQHCFSDLRKYMSSLDRSLQSDFQRQTSAINSPEDDEAIAKDTPAMVAVINWLKFEYCFNLSFEGDEGSKSQVEDFARRCLSLFRATNRSTVDRSPLTIESQPTDDLCLLAVMSLLRLRAANLDTQPYPLPSGELLRATVVLEHLIRKSPHNYEALLLLTRAYLLLGAGSLALKAFSKLAVKQTQYETVAHNLFTRLSTIHPESAPSFGDSESKDTDPQIALRHALMFYRGSETSIPNARKTGLEHGSYVNVERSIDFQKSLQNSICRKMWALEARRMQRLVGGPSTNQYDHIVFNSTPVVDKRNFDGFMNCEPPNQSSFEEHMRIGPLPGARSVKAMTQTDILFNFLNKFSSQKKIPADVTLPSVDLAVDLTKTEMTAAEIDNTRIHLTLLNLISSLLSQHKSSKADSTSSPADLDGLISSVESWLTDTHTSLSSSSKLPTTLINVAPHSTSANSSHVPSWIYLHSTLCTLETLKAISLFISFTSKLKLPSSSRSSPKFSKDSLTRLNDLILTVVKDIKSQVRTLKTHIAESGLLGQLVSIATSGPESRDGETNGVKEDEGSSLSSLIEELLGMSSLELFCGSVMESWEEALDGVSRVCGSFV